MVMSRPQQRVTERGIARGTTGHSLDDLPMTPQQNHTVGFVRGVADTVTSAFGALQMVTQMDDKSVVLPCEPHHAVIPNYSYLSA